jgi:ParB family transcriptional regulator, chromosome partitioning protein
VPEQWQGVASGAPGRGIGRGLAAILAQSERETDGLRHLAVDLVRPNPRQPRREFHAESLHALAESIKARGVLQPLVVRPIAGGTFELVAGERRLRAARIAGLDEVPAVVRQTDEAEQLELALIENVAREDLNPVEEARACATLVEDLGVTKEELGRRSGRSRVAVSNLIRLLDLPDEALDMISAGALSEGHGRALLMCRDQSERRRLAREASAQGWSVRETERRAKRSAPEGDPAARPTVTIHPDLADALAAAEDALTAALGREVRVRPHRGGYRVELDLSEPREGIELAERILRRTAA